MRQQLAALAEKVALTALQAYLAALVLADGLGVTGADQAWLAAIAAALNVIALGIPVVPAGLTFAVDLVLRTVRTFVVGFITLLVAAPVLRLDIDAVNAAAFGALPAAIAVAKGLIASRIGNHTTAALLPARLDLNE